MIAIIVVLAGLDLVGALLAKEWTLGRNTWMFAGGAAVFDSRVIVEYVHVWASAQRVRYVRQWEHACW